MCGHLDLDLIHTHASAFTESGLPTLSLFFAAFGQTTFVGTPAVEIRQRIDLNGRMTLRPYASAGISLFSNSGWQVQSGFVGVPASSGLFTTTIGNGADRTLLRFDPDLCVVRQQGTRQQPRPERAERGQHNLIGEPEPAMMKPRSRQSLTMSCSP